MANPLNVNCTQDEWTIVATNVTTGTIIRKNSLAQYVITTRANGQPAPNNADPSEGRRAFTKSNQEVISSSSAIDVYIYSFRREGVVEVTV
jgi:hypothetical protein